MGTAEFTSLAQAAYPQGAAAYFELPYATPHEERLQSGVVLTRTGYNEMAQRIGVCPLLPAAECVSSIWAIPVGDNSYCLRPDLLSFVPRSHVQVIRHETTGQPRRIQSDTVTRAIERFIAIITPTRDKVREPTPSGFLRFGQIGFFKSIPDPEIPWVQHRDRLGLCLSPPNALSQFALIVPRSKEAGNFNLRSDISQTPESRNPRRYITSSVMALDTSRLHYAGIHPRTSMDEQALRGLISKMKALFYESDCERVCAKYPREIGKEGLITAAGIVGLRP